MWVSRREIARLLRHLSNQSQRIVDLEGELRFERERNRRREDDLVNQALLAAGRRAIDRAEPSSPEPKPLPQPKPLTGLEEARLMALRQAAVEAGRPAHEADKLFYAERNGQPSPIGLPDELYIVPTV